MEKCAYHLTWKVSQSAKGWNDGYKHRPTYTDRTAITKPNSFPLGKESRLITYFSNIPNGKMPVSQMV